MNTLTQTKLELWTNEAGPRQSKEVQRALHKLSQAGSGTLYKQTSPMTGEDTEHIEQVMCGTASPEEDRQRDRCITACNDIHAKYGGTSTRENCRDIIADCQKAFPALEAQRPVVDQRKTPEQFQEEKREREAARLEREKKEAKEADTLAAEVAKLREQYPYLIPCDRHGGGVQTAKNIRIILKREFPATKFSVKADYSSINIRWTDGPTSEAVDEHVQPFQEGHFDGMDDSYKYERTAWTEAFGGVQYVFTNRDYREGLREAVRASLDLPGNLDGWEAEQWQNRQTNTALANTDLTGKGDFTGSEFSYDEQRPVLRFETTAQPVKASAPAQGTGYTIEEHTHTKKGFQMFIVVLAQKVERVDFDELRERARDLGGWYSRAWGRTPGGFAFKERGKAEVFATSLGLDKGPDGTDTPTSPTPGRADKLRGMADKLTSQIEDKRAPMTQNPTPKRTLQYKSRLIDGDHLERVQRALYALADALEAGTWPDKIPSKADLMEYLRTRTDGSGGYYETMDTGEYSNTSPEAVRVQQLLETAKTPEQEKEETERKREREIKDKILSLAGVKIPGFFVTPESVAERVMQEANIQEGEKVLEPSAGTGNLADRAREAGGLVQCVEIRPALVEILELKGFDTICGDFTSPEETGDFERFDKVIMNPPFENGQDSEHVRAAFACLEEGGRLVAVMGEGSFFRSDSKAVAFRAWLEDVGGWSEKLPEGSFKGSGEVTQTGTNTRIVVIDK